MFNHPTLLIRDLQTAVDQQHQSVVNEILRDLLDLKPTACEQVEKPLVDALLQGFQLSLPMNVDPHVIEEAPPGMLSLRQRLTHFRLKVVSQWPLEHQQYYFFCHNKAPV